MRSVDDGKKLTGFASVNLKSLTFEVRKRERASDREKHDQPNLSSVSVGDMILTIQYS